MDEVIFEDRQHEITITVSRDKMGMLIIEIDTNDKDSYPSISVDGQNINDW